MAKPAARIRERGMRRIDMKLPEAIFVLRRGLLSDK